MLEARVGEHRVKGNGRGHWSKEESKPHIKVLELKAAKLAIMTFTMPNLSRIFFSNIVAMFS